jgi:hypothetical protein
MVEREARGRAGREQLEEFAAVQGERPGLGRGA